MNSIRIWIAAILAVLSLALGAAPVAAQTISSNATGTLLAVDDSNELGGETITPPSANPLQSYTLYLSRVTPTFSVTAVIYEWDPIGGTSVGPPVWTGPTVAVVNTTYDPYTFTPNISLDPTRQYVLAVVQAVPGETGRLQAGFVNNVPGHAVWRNDPVWGQNVLAEYNFSATFAVPATVPTLSEWAMILFALILAGGAALHLQRRRAPA